MPRVGARSSGLAAALAVWLCGGSPLDAQTITGRLLERGTDRAVRQGLVVMVDEAGDTLARSLTDDVGAFTVRAPDAGSFLLIASAFGYRRTAAGLFELGRDARMSLEFRVAPEALPLDELVVALDRPVWNHTLVTNGFVERVSRGLGAFLTPRDIERSHALDTPSLLRGINGVMVVPRGGESAFLGDRVALRSTSGGLCSPMVFVDGMRVRLTPEESLDQLVPVHALEAVEIYRRPAEVPIEYASLDRHRGPERPPGGCGVLLFWTRRR